MDALALRRLDRLIWVLLAMIAAIVLAAPAVSDFRIVWHAFIAPAATCTVLIAGSWFHRHWRTDPRLASGLTSTAQVVALAAVGAPLSYIAASAQSRHADGDAGRRIALFHRRFRQGRAGRAVPRRSTSDCRTRRNARYGTGSRAPDRPGLTDTAAQRPVFARDFPAARGYTPGARDDAMPLTAQQL